MAPATLTEKILARAAGVARVQPGEIVTCKVDLAMFHDSSGPRRVAPRLRELGTGVWDPSRVVVVSDHYVPAVDPESAAILKLTRDWVAEQKIGAFYDMQGICHVMLAEGGHLRPGLFCVGGDSHSTMGGSFGCYMAGFGATEMTGVMATGEIWTRVPESIRVEWSGVLPDGVVAKDIMLFLCRTLGMENNFRAVEYAGPTVRSMSMAERQVLTNMAAELGAENGIVEPDQVTLAAIRAAGGHIEDAEIAPWHSDPGAVYAEHHRFDAATLQPQVAAPHSPANAGPIGDIAGQHIDQAYIGACVGAKLNDLQMAARVLAGRKVASGTRLLIAPSSRATTEAAIKDGTMQILTEAGAILLSTGCGACAGLGAGVLAEGEVCISSTNRNFKGRMGHKDASVYLGSPYTVAASAIEGRIADPRAFLVN
jgi:3-isopropylmalate/(R)-2-methylmalate dehydratase large subunit